MFVKINKNPNNILIASYRSGDLIKFCDLIDNGESVNCINEIGESLITEVIKNFDQHDDEKNMLFLKKLIEYDVFMENLSGKATILNTALQFSNWEKTVPILVNVGADPMERDVMGRNFLHSISTINGGEKLYDIAIKAKIDVNCKDQYNCTPLMLASGEGMLPLINHLLKDNAAINIQDNDGETAAMYSARRGKIKCLNFLMENGTNKLLKDKKGNNIAHKIALSGNSIEENDTKEIEYFIKNNKKLFFVKNKNKKTACDIFKEYQNEKYEKFYN